MKHTIVLSLFSTCAMIVIMCGCAPKIQQQIATQQEVQQSQQQQVQQQQTTPQKEPEPQATPEQMHCTTDLKPHQIKAIKLSLDETGLQKNLEGFSFRMVPVDETGTKVILAEGTITIIIYSTKEDNPLASEYIIYSRSVHVKPEEAMPDCGPKPIIVLFKDIRASSNYRYVKTPNPGILLVQFTRTGSEQIFEQQYRAAEHNEYIIT